MLIAEQRPPFAIGLDVFLHRSCYRLLSAQPRNGPPGAQAPCKPILLNPTACCIAPNESPPPPHLQVRPGSDGGPALPAAAHRQPAPTRAWATCRYRQIGGCQTIETPVAVHWARRRASLARRERVSGLPMWQKMPALFYAPVCRPRNSGQLGLGKRALSRLAARPVCVSWSPVLRGACGPGGSTASRAGTMPGPPPSRVAASRPMSAPNARRRSTLPPGTPSNAA